MSEMASGMKRADEFSWLRLKADRVAREIYNERPGFMPICAISMGFLSGVDFAVDLLQRERDRINSRGPRELFVEVAAREAA